MPPLVDRVRASTRARPCTRSRPLAPRRHRPARAVAWLLGLLVLSSPGCATYLLWDGLADGGDRRLVESVVAVSEQGGERFAIARLEGGDLRIYDSVTLDEDGRRVRLAEAPRARRAAAAGSGAAAADPGCLSCAGCVSRTNGASRPASTRCAACAGRARAPSGALPCPDQLLVLVSEPHGAPCEDGAVLVVDSDGRVLPEDRLLVAETQELARYAVRVRVERELGGALLLTFEGPGADDAARTLALTGPVRHGRRLGRGAARLLATPLTLALDLATLPLQGVAAAVIIASF